MMLVLRLLFDAFRRDPNLIPHASTKCTVCGIPQNASNMQQCIECQQHFCAFIGGYAKLNDKLDSMAQGPALLILLVGTAFSIIGGIIAVLLLAIPYYLLRALLPGQPRYWRRCGGSVYGPAGQTYRTEHQGERCNKCGGAVPAHYPPVSYQTEDYQNHGSTSSGLDDEDRWLMLYNSDDNESSNYEPHIMDGWLVNWGKEKDDDEDQR